MCWGGREVPQHWPGWPWAGSRFLFKRWGAASSWRGAVTTSKLICGTVGPCSGDQFILFQGLYMHIHKHLKLMVWMISYLLLCSELEIFQPVVFVLIFFPPKSCISHSLYLLCITLQNAFEIYTLSWIWIPQIDSNQSFFIFLCESLKSFVHDLNILIMLCVCFCSQWIHFSRKACSLSITLQ